MFVTGVDLWLRQYFSDVTPYIVGVDLAFYRIVRIVPPTVDAFVTGGDQGAKYHLARIFERRHIFDDVTYFTTSRYEVFVTGVCILLYIPERGYQLAASNA